MIEELEAAFIAGGLFASVVLVFYAGHRLSKRIERKAQERSKRDREILEGKSRY